MNYLLRVLGQPFILQLSPERVVEFKQHALLTSNHTKYLCPARKSFNNLNVLCFSFLMRAVVLMHLWPRIIHIQIKSNLHLVSNRYVACTASIVYTNKKSIRTAVRGMGLTLTNGNQEADLSVLQTKLCQRHNKVQEWNYAGIIQVISLTLCERQRILGPGIKSDLAVKSLNSTILQESL